MPWSLLVLSLPTDNTAARMRAWRSLKAGGAVVLRDGVYVLPDGPAQREHLREVAADVRANGGSARLLTGVHAEEPIEPLFDRSAEFAPLVEAAKAALKQPDAARSARRLRKAFDELAAIDYFAGEAQRQAAETVAELEHHVAQAADAGEPRSASHAVARANRAAYQGRMWATRRRPWVDRLASAWLIRRFIDPAARFVWLTDTAQAPRRAVGFDFDGAAFTHVGTRVTFEVLVAAFDLGSPALHRMGTLVHGLDAGGVRPPESAGVERVLAGMRDAIADDDALMLAAAGVFEGLFHAFEKETAA